MNTQKILDTLAEFITQNKQQRMNEVVAQRMRHVTIALENISQPHNSSAVVRSADCFGVQDVHVIEETQRFSDEPGISMGSFQWIDLQRHATTTACYDTLKQQGYMVLATSPHKDGYELHNVPVDKKVALVFGTELTGLSDTALQQADGYVRIPMHGFTESFNISVSVALCLYQLTTKLRSSDIDWQLSTAEQQEILLAWYRRVVRGSAGIEKRLLG